MNKNTIAFLLMGGILFWMMSNSAKEEELLAQEKAKTEKEQNSVQQVLGSVNEVADSYRAAEIQVNPTDSTQADTLPAPKLEEQSLLVKTDKFEITFSNKGAKIHSMVLKTLEGPDGQFPELLQEKEFGMLGLEIDEKDFSQVLFETSTKDKEEVVVKDSFELKYTWQDAEGRLVRRIYKFTTGSDKFDHHIEFENFTPKDLRYHWKSGMSETEDITKIGSFGSNYYFSEVIFSDGETVSRETTDEADKFNEDKAGLEWLGLRRRYAAVFFQFDQQVESRIATLPVPQEEENPAPVTYAISWGGAFTAAQTQFEVHLQPLVYEQLKAMGGKQEEILFSGWSWIGADYWFVGLCGLILSFLNSLYGFLGNYGFAIMLLTFLVKLATMPLTLNQIKSMRAMAEHKPALDALRKKHSKDPSRYQTEMLKYYKEAGINPLAPVMGCLPMFLQMPIFIGLFVVLGRAVELRGQPFLGWITDLSQPDIIYSGLSIPLVMPHGLSLLPPIMAATMYFQMKQSMTSADPIAKNMVFVMPVMMFLFSAVMPSGLVVYWIVSNLFTIFQYKFVGSANTPASKEDAVEAKVVKSKKKKNK